MHILTWRQKQMETPIVRDVTGMYRGGNVESTPKTRWEKPVVTSGRMASIDHKPAGKKRVDPDTRRTAPATQHLKIVLSKPQITRKIYCLQSN